MGLSHRLSGDWYVHTKDGWLLVVAEVVVGEVKECAQFLSEEVDKGLMVFLPHQTVGEDTETLMHPETSHGLLSVMVVLVGTQEALEHLQ